MASRKRKAGTDGSEDTSSPSPVVKSGRSTQRATAARYFTGSLSEERMNGDGGSALTAELESRQFWERWSTPLLFAWLMDYRTKDRPKGFSDKSINDRENLLTWLVVGGYIRPTANIELKLLQDNWKEITKWTPASGIEIPGVFIPPPIASSQSAVDAAAAVPPVQGRSSQSVGVESKEEKQSIRMVSAPARLSAEANAFAVSAVSSSPHVSFSPLSPPSFGGGHRSHLVEPDDEEEEMEEDQEEDDIPAAALPARGSGGRPPLPPAIRGPNGEVQSLGMRAMMRAQPPARRCLTCLKPPIDPYEAQWICECGLRGDKAADSPENNLISAGRALKLAGASGPAAAAASSSMSGQNTNTQGSEAKRLDRELVSLAAAGPHHPMFVGPDSSAALPSGAAISISRKAFNASSTEISGAPLLALIRSGRLMSVGYCIPRSLAATALAKVAGVSINIDGVDVPVQSGGVSAPPVPSLQAFCTALFSVILPALSDKPNALMQWVALGRTAIELERLHGWTKAYMYVEQLLQERVETGTEFASPSVACLNTLQFVSIGASGVPYAHSQGAGGPNHGSSRAGGFCEAHNWKNGCNFLNCPLRHECQFAANGCNDSFGHASQVCAFRNRGGYGNNRGGYGNNRRGGRGGNGGGNNRTPSGGSVTTTTSSKSKTLPSA